MQKKKVENKKKLKLGIFSFTCCEGCSVVFIELLNKRFFEYKKLIDFRNFRQLKSNKVIDNLDLAIIEGAISTESEKRKLKEIRKKAKRIVAIGTCAVGGMPSSQRNFFSVELKKKISPLVKKLHQLETIEPLHKFVKIDETINGCPINIKDLDKIMKEHLKKIK